MLDYRSVYTFNHCRLSSTCPPTQSSAWIHHPFLSYLHFQILIQNINSITPERSDPINFNRKKTKPLRSFKKTHKTFSLKDSEGDSLVQSFGHIFPMKTPKSVYILLTVSSRSTPISVTHHNPRPQQNRNAKVLMSSADCFSVSEAKRSKIWASASASIAAVGSSKTSLGILAWWRIAIWIARFGCFIRGKGFRFAVDMEMNYMISRYPPFS